MSRIGKKAITVPAGVEVIVNDHKVTVKGPKGTLEREIHKNISVTVENNEVKVTRPNDEALNRSLHGLTRTLISNMIEGVEKEYTTERSEENESSSWSDQNSDPQHGSWC